MTEEWVSARADELERSFGGPRGALCALIAEHEEAPVDPRISQEVSLLISRFGSSTASAALVEAAVKRGMELAREAPHA